MGILKDFYYEQYGLPFKLYKKNGTEVLLLELDKEKEMEFIDKLDKLEELIREKYYRYMVYGEDLIITDKELEDL
jgi:hypothetical protein